jgi:hypothetical protein
MDNSSFPRNYRFGPFELQPRQRRLLRNGEVIRSLRVRSTFWWHSSSAGGIALQRRIDATGLAKLVVEESNLQVQISALRKIVGPRSIETVPACGYRFLLPVDDVASNDSPCDARVHNIPRPLTRFVAPQGQIEACARMLEGSRLLTLTGGGGFGKTRLLQETAATYLGGFDDIWFVDLGRVTDARSGAAGGSDDARLTNDASGEDPVEVVQRYVNDRRTLLLLDNCEHLRSACAEFVRQLLQGSPRLKVFATSPSPCNCGRSDAGSLAAARSRPHSSSPGARIVYLRGRAAVRRPCDGGTARFRAEQG